MSLDVLSQDEGHSGACLCVFSAVLKHMKEGLCVCLHVCVRAAFSFTIIRPWTTPLIQADLKEKACRGHTTHSYDTCCLACKYEARLAPSQLSRTFSRCRLLLNSPPQFKKLIQTRHGGIMKVRSIDRNVQYLKNLCSAYL